MALGARYATLAELKSRLGIPDTDDDGSLGPALDTASRGIEKHCDRQFNDADTATARLFYPRTSHLADVDDFHTTTGLIVETDGGDDGTFETTWSTSDYQLEPLNGIVDGETGWPKYQIRAVNGRTFPCGRRATLRVTARWGWAAVPAPVKEATLVLAEDVFKLKDSPFGSGGFSEFGRIRARANPHVVMLLNPYRRNAVLVG